MTHFSQGCLIALALSCSCLAARRDVTDAEIGKDLLLSRGDLLVVHLPSNRSTGFCWQPSFSKPGVLKAEGDTYSQPDRKSPPLVGTGGTESWTFRAQKEGSITLTLGYLRPWEKGVVPVKILSWPVSVHP